MKAKRKGVRWGHVREIKHVKRIFDGRFKAPIMTDAFAALPKRLRHLAAWRRMHMVPGGHDPVHRFGSTRGISPSSDLQLKNGKLKYIAKREGYK